uniref:Rho-related GTP-binding protein RhoU n=1 Tax=Steinernema glaseri TaxID=37863 RepID=A0A1I7Y7D0_9BILA
MIRAVVVGDAGVGKASILFSYLLELNPYCSPVVSDAFVTHVEVRGRIHETSISCYRTLEALDGSTSPDVVVLCFDVTRPETLRTAQNKWIPGLRSAFGDVPVVLTGLKADFREAYKIHKGLYLSIVGEKPVKRKTARKVTNMPGNIRYMECSAYRAQEVTAKMAIIRIVFVGDEGVGKASILFAHSLERNPKSVPNVLQTFISKVTLRDRTHETIISSCSSVEDIKNGRLCSLTDVFVVCYSVTCSQSLCSAMTKWIPSIQSYYPNRPIILAGTKIDERKSYDAVKAAYLASGKDKPVKKRKGRKIAENFSNVTYAECSSRDSYSVEQLLQRAAKSALATRVTINLCAMM